MSNPKDWADKVALAIALYPGATLDAKQAKEIADAIRTALAGAGYVVVRREVFDDLVDVMVSKGDEKCT